MTNAPNVKHLPKDKLTEAIIFAGADAYSHMQHWTESEGVKAGDNVPPVYIGPKQLKDLGQLRIVDDGRRYARVYRAGELSELQAHTIATKLALAGVSEARLFDGIHEQKPAEDWTPQLPRLRAEAEKGNSFVAKIAERSGTANLSQMAASQRGELLASRYGQVAVNPESEAVFHYDGSTWVKLADSELRREMVAVFNEHETPYSPAGINNALEAMKLNIPVICDPARHLIGFENGVYDMHKKCFRPHDAGDWLQNHNGITFTEAVPGESLSSHAPNFHKWLSHAAGGDTGKMNRINAAMFMILANRYDWQMFIEVTGEGGSGKSVFTHIASLLAGQHNTASGSMKALDEARGRAQFVGKNLIILPDQVKYVGEGSGIKAVTGGDLVEIDGKYEKQFSIVLQAVVLATNNEPMSFTERNGGIARRRVIFPFNLPVKDSDKDPHLADKISAELPVIIRHLLREFTSPDKARQLLIEQRESAEAMAVKRFSDPMYGFCAFIVSLGEEAGMYMGNKNITPRVPRKYLYHAYLSYMEAHGYERPLTLTKFGEAMPKIMQEYRCDYRKFKTKTGYRYNVDLNGEANDWLPSVSINDPHP